MYVPNNHKEVVKRFAGKKNIEVTLSPSFCSFPSPSPLSYPFYTGCLSSKGGIKVQKKNSIYVSTHSPFSLFFFLLTSALCSLRLDSSPLVPST